MTKTPNIDKFIKDANSVKLDHINGISFNIIGMLVILANAIKNDIARDKEK